MTKQEAREGEDDNTLSRRLFITAMGAGAVAAGSGAAWAQAPSPAGPPSTVTNPPRDFGPGGAPTTYFTDPDIISVDPLFNQYAQPNSAIVLPRTILPVSASSGQPWSFASLCPGPSGTRAPWPS